MRIDPDDQEGTEALAPASTSSAMRRSRLAAEARTLRREIEAERLAEVQRELQTLKI